MSEEKKVFKYVLSVDFEGGDGADFFPIEEENVDESKAKIDAHFSELLFASYPPPKVEVVGLTKEEWDEAERVGAERAAQEDV